MNVGSSSFRKINGEFPLKFVNADISLKIRGGLSPISFKSLDLAFSRDDKRNPSSYMCLLSLFL